MAITSIPTEKIVPGKAVKVEILESTVADAKDVFQGQVLTVSYEAFITLRAYGKARLAPSEAIPLAEPAPTKAEPGQSEPLAEAKPKGRWGRK